MLERTALADSMVVEDREKPLVCRFAMTSIMAGQDFTSAGTRERRFVLLGIGLAHSIIVFMDLGSC